MYRIVRGFLPYLVEDEVAALLRLEINEYSRRPKLKKISKPETEMPVTSFAEIEIAIRDGNPERVAVLLDAFLQLKGRDELARYLLLLGSGYLNQSLGHSVSCTAFILLEMMDRIDHDDPWPALVALADYFCKGGFHTTPQFPRTTSLPTKEADNQHLLRATSGDGIVNLHHTITRYAIERIRHVLSEPEYAHMIACWVEFIGSKDITTPHLDSSGETLSDYERFYHFFSKHDERAVLSYVQGALPSEKGRHTLGRYLIKGICDLYQGDYDPHFLTGLGSVLWVMDNYWSQPLVPVNALRQYLNYYFTEVG